MLDEKLEAKLLKVFEDRFSDFNEEVLVELAKVIKQFDNLTPTQAYKVAQQLKYNTTVNKLLNKLSKLSGKSVSDLKKVLEKVAKENIDFSEVYYKARGMNKPIYDENMVLQNIVNSAYKLGGEQLANLSRSTGFRLLDSNGKPMYLDIGKAYKEVIDRCVYAVTTGKDTYQNQMRKTLKELTNSGVRKIEYESGYSQRLDTAIRRNVLDTMREVANNVQQELGKEFGSDGVEVTVHLNPAPDHQNVQGKQFSNEEFYKFQNDTRAVSYDGVVFEPEYEGRDRRSISQYNCYHNIMSIVLGVNKPQYTNEQLKEIKDNANKKIEFDGKEYTHYEATQLQRKLETQIRTEKETQMMAKISGNKEQVIESQTKIRDLKAKYNQLSKASGISGEAERLTVGGYHYSPYKEMKIKYDVFDGDTITISVDTINKRRKGIEHHINFLKDYNIELEQVMKKRNIDFDGNSNDATIRRVNLSRIEKDEQELKEFDNSKPKKITLNTLEDCKELLNYKNIHMEIESFEDCDFKLIKENVKQLHNLSSKYPKIEEMLNKNGITLSASKKIEDDVLAETSPYQLILNANKYKDYEKLYELEYWNVLSGWHSPASKEKLTVKSMIHEFGHNVSYKMRDIYNEKGNIYMSMEEWNKKLADDFMDYATKELNKDKEQLIYVFLSDYGKTNSAELFAEVFADCNSGASSLLGETLEKYLEEKLK